MNETPIQNLDGYLQSLRRLSGNLCDFWVEVFEVKTDIEIDLREKLLDRSITLFDKVQVGYREIDNVLNTYVFSKLQVQDGSLFELFAWDIVEGVQKSVSPCGEPANALRLLAVKNARHVDAHF